MSIRENIERAIDKLIENDMVLIENNMEWATAHKLARYLEDHYPEWNIDCEYNKMGPGFVTKHDSNNQYRRPDIIIHQRGSLVREHNLLVIELKMATGDDGDIEKLIDFTSDPSGDRGFQYQFGLKISFHPGMILRWFRNGHEVEVQ
ncbi:MAG: hypothetical protein KZQ91_20695 [Candidatus Thiodiazotropha sp. (ex Lucinoma borealis)]|nr:hypothetical protein [Candidatus Thiodiazotropha sp. (ex Lucinoma borealis)]